VLDPRWLVGVDINPEIAVLKVAAGPAKPDLVEQGWSTFLIKVTTTPAPRRPNIFSRRARSVYSGMPRTRPTSGAAAGPASRTIRRRRWLDLEPFDKAPSSLR